MFPSPIFLACVKWQTGSYCRKAFGGAFSCESLTWENGKLIAREGKIINPGYFSTTFSEACLNPSFDWRHFSISGFLNISDLRIDHQNKTLRKPSPISTFRIPFLKINLETEIKEGVVFFDKGSGFYFDLLHRINDHHVIGNLILRGEGFDTELTADFERTGKGCFKFTPQFHTHSFPQLANLVTYFFHSSLPEVAKHWHFSQGLIDGKLDVTFLNGEPQEMKGRLALTDIQGENPFLELHGEIDHCEALLDIDFRSVSTINGEFILQGGRCSFQESGKFWGGIWDLSHLQSRIFLKEGKLEASSLQGSLMGMEGEIVLDWQSSDVLMYMGFHGVSKEMRTLFPEAFQDKFAVAFPNDYFALQAMLKRTKEGLQLDGNFSITIPDGETYHLDFGCLLGQSNEVHAGLIPDLPFSLSRSVDQFLEHLSDQFCLSQKRLGWFRGKCFPLEKFFAPFFLHGLPLHLQGRADFEGTFDERYLVIFYEGDRFSIDSPSFSLDAEQNSEIFSSGVAAVHYVDLENWDHVGFLPLKGAVYHQKRQDFFLTDADAVVHFENNKIHIKDITAYFNQLCLKGDVEIDIRSLDDIDLDLHADYVSGPAEDAQSLLKHFVSSPFFDFPLIGTFESLSEAIFFRYHFHPAAQLVLGKIQGHLVDCSIQNPLLQVEKLKASLNYDFSRNQLHIQNMEGEMEVPFGTRDYHLSIPSLIFSQFPDFQVAFQLDLIDLAGESIALKGSMNTLEGRREIACKGFSSYLKEHVAFHAEQEGKRINLSELAIGTGKGKGVFLLEKEYLKLEQFNWVNKSDLFNFSGLFDRRQHKLAGSVSSFKWDLTTSFNKWLSLWNPKGILNGAASIEWSKEKGFKGDCKASFQDLTFSGIQFGSGEDLRCAYSDQEGLSVEGLAIEVPMGEKIERYKLGRFHYAAAEQKITFEKLVFSLPSEKLSWAVQAISKVCSNSLSLDWIEAFKQEEPLEGTLSLEIYPNTLWVCLKLKDGLYHFGTHCLDLKDFLLTYDPYELNVWAKCFHRQTGAFWLHFVGDSLTMSHGTLAISEKELSRENQAGCGALITRWDRHPEQGFSISSIEGALKGVDISLKASEMESSTDHFYLYGRVSCNPKKVASLFANKLANVFERTALSGYYTLEGKWVISKADWKDAAFLGILSGRDLNIFGIEFDNCSAECYYQQGLIQCSNLLIKDWAGRICLDQAKLEKKDNKWSFFINQLHIDELRLSRLRSPWTQWDPKDRPFYRSFFIRSFLLNDFNITLGELDSAVGYGKLEFTNLPKRTIISNLLLLPTEITARIGLDLTTLIPVKGIVSYSIEKERVYFNEFIEMYSDGKHSRFYLAEGAPAYIDFKGNLLLNVKMKQYNLLMKLAEFFTINIKGPLLNPSYTFSRQFDADESMDSS